MVVGRAEPALGRSDPPAWKVVGASVTGAGHRASGLGCQDSHAWTLVDHDTVVAAVADGAGSARLAAEGARIASGFSVEYVAWRLDEPEPAPPEELLLDALTATRSRLDREARGAGHPVADLATTLAIALATADGLWAAQVGDGSVVVAHPDGTLTAVAAGEREEYLNETTFLTSKRWRAAAVVEEAPVPVESVALLTDGLGLLALDLSDGGRPYLPFFAPLLGYARAESAHPIELERFLESERVASRTDDDVTLLLATRS